MNRRDAEWVVCNIVVPILVAVLVSVLAPLFLSPILGGK